MLKFLFTLLILGPGTLLAQEKSDSDPFRVALGKVVEETDWPKKAVRIVAVTYDYTQDRRSPSVVVRDRLHKGVFLISSKLTKEQTKMLYSSITGQHTPWKPFMCFMPHHGFVFYDETDKIVGSMSLCFQCRAYRAWPQGELSRHWDLDALKKLLLELKMPFHKNDNAYTAAFDRYLAAQPEKPIK